MEAQTMLKLIINNSDPASKGALSRQSANVHNNYKTCQKETLLFDCREISSNLYIFMARDLDHELACEMTLELTEGFAPAADGIHEEDYIVPILTCNSLSIDVSRFNEKVCWDAYLQAMLLLQFQLKILEELLLFCEEKDVVTIMLTLNDTEEDDIEVFQRFSLSSERVITPNGEQAKIVIQAGTKTYDSIIDFIDEINRNFHQALWRNQKTNAAFRNYIKGHSLQVH
jgi:hypothetical protein